MLVHRVGVSVLNHIDRADKLWSSSTILSLNDVLAIEIFNGGSDLISTGTWDTVLSAGKNVWGSANDDSHHSSWSGDGYTVVNSDLAIPTEAEILSEMNDGNFYASRGLDLSISVTDNTISASTTNGHWIRWIKKNGTVIKTTHSQNDSYTVDGSEQYVRVEILDPSSVVKAWSQPLTVTGYDYWINSAVNPPTNMSAARNCICSGSSSKHRFIYLVQRSTVCSRLE